MRLQEGKKSDVTCSEAVDEDGTERFKISGETPRELCTLEYETEVRDNKSGERLSSSGRATLDSTRWPRNALALRKEIMVRRGFPKCWSGNEGKNSGVYAELTDNVKVGVINLR